MKTGFAETLLMIVASRVHPTFVAVTSAPIVCVGSAKMTNTFAPAAFSASTCDVTLVEVASYDCALLLAAQPAPAGWLCPAR